MARRLTVETEALVASANHWQIAWDVIRSQLEGGPYAADHACEWETSEYLALKPQLVQRDNEARRGLMSPRSGIDSVLPESDRRISTMRRATRAADEQEDDAAA